MITKERPKIEVKYRGEEVSQETLMYISDNYFVTLHAQEMIQKRHSDIDITESIRNPMIAYFNTDGSINCAVNKDEYFVIATDRLPFPIVTFKEKSWHGKDVFEKRQMAIDGFDRKYK